MCSTHPACRPPEGLSDSFTRLPLTLAIFWFSVAFGFSQGGGAFGLKPESLAQLIAGNGPSTVLALDSPELADTGTFGPSAYYYLARWLEARVPGASNDTPSRDAKPSPDAKGAPEAAARARLLYRMAYDRGSGLVRRESGLALLKDLRTAGLWEELLAFSSEYAQAEGPEWKSERPRLDALSMLDRTREQAALAGTLAAAFPKGLEHDWPLGEFRGIRGHQNFDLCGHVLVDIGNLCPHVAGIHQVRAIQHVSHGAVGLGAVGGV